MGNRRGILSRPAGRKSPADVLRYVYMSVFVVVLVTVGWGLYRAVLYTRGTESLAIRNVQVRGERRVTESEILARVGHVPGSNAFAVRLDEVRTAVEGLGWVRHATVHRVWPNELAIEVVERDAVALARIDGRIVQADEDGMILPLDPLADTDLPILDGLDHATSAVDTASNRAKVAVYLRVLDELDGTVLSEVHVSDSGEVSVVPIDNAVAIDLGADEHIARWTRYQALRDRIHADFPQATRIDLRFKDQVIIQVDDGEPAEKIIWADETKLL
jgi:cell division septal protein FtsQ